MISFPVQAVALILLIFFSYTDDGVTKKAKGLFWFVLASLSAIAVYKVFGQYQTWANNELGQFLLPPHQDSYFLFFVFIKLLSPFLIAVAVAFLLIPILGVINKRFEGKFFEVAEPYLAATTIILLGYPALLFYFLLIILAYLAWHVFSYIKSHEQARLSLYHMWVPIGLITLMVSKYWLVHTPLWLLLKI